MVMIRTTKLLLPAVSTVLSTLCRLIFQPSRFYEGDAIFSILIFQRLLLLLSRVSRVQLCVTP